MNWTMKDLENYLKRPEKSHLDYTSDKNLWKFLKRFYKKYN